MHLAMTVCKNSVKLSLLQQSLSPARCKIIMADKSLKVDVQIAKKNQGLTPFSGLYAIKKLWDILGLPGMIDKCIGARKNKGYSDSEQIFAAVLLNLAGGDAPEHIGWLKNILSLPGQDIKTPSATAMRSYAACFHEPENDELRQQGRALIPIKNSHLISFEVVHRHLFNAAYQYAPRSEITLDQDGTFIETNIAQALYNYKKQLSLQALNMYCHEYDMMVATEYRDGNVNPGQGQLEQLKNFLAFLPEGIKKVRFRSDSAGYQIDLIKFCAEGKETGVGVIDFAISCPMYESFLEAVKAVREEDWQYLKDSQQCAEVIYAPNSLSTSKKGPTYRFIAIREYIGAEEERSRQLLLPGMIEQLEAENENVKKLHLTDMYGNVYKVFGVLTNIDIEEMSAAEVVLWHRGRCGKSEEVHHILKEELAGGHVISGKLGANAFWWNVSVLAMSLHSLLKQMVLPEVARRSRPKTLRAFFYTMAGRVVHHARHLILRVDDGIGARWLKEAWERLDALSFSFG